MKRSVRRLAVAAGSAALAVGSLAAPAQASSPGSDCPAGYACGWSGLNATGSMLKTKVSMATLGTWDNRIRSYYNRTSGVACWFDGASYSGSFFAEPRGNGVTMYDSSLDRKISSIKLVRNERDCDDTPYVEWYSDQASKAAGFGDLNGDRRADLLSRDRSGRLWFVSGTRAGTLIGAGWNVMTALTRHGDLNGDGREDLLARDTTGKLWFYPGNGYGKFGARHLIGAGWNTMTTISAVGDVTADGRGDLVARDTAGTLWLYPGTGHGAFAARKKIDTGWKSVSATTGPGDLNGDGHPDLLARELGKLWFYPGTGKGGFAARRLIGAGW
ncbi:FG-GAP-like repeat-containing protein, partial [Actinacidiphila rubida]